MMTESSFRRLWDLIDARRVIDRHPWVNRCIDFDVTPHLLRHTFAARCFEDGLDVKEVQHLLGHASPEITMKIYLHYCEAQRQKDTFDKMRRSRENILAKKQEA